MQHSIRKLVNSLSLLLSICIVIVSNGLLLQSYVSADSFNPDIVNFVTSLYSDCLGRQPDPAGLNDWCTRLTNHSATGKQCAYGFFFSSEFQSKANTMSDYELITAYYWVFLNRMPDSGGMTYWASSIADTTNDISVLFTGFADSTEFSQKCASYGIDVGNHIDVPTTSRTTSTVTTTSSATSSISSSSAAVPQSSTSNSATTYIINTNNGTIHRQGCGHLPSPINSHSVQFTPDQLNAYTGHRCGHCFS